MQRAAVSVCVCVLLKGYLHCQIKMHVSHLCQCCTKQVFIITSLCHFSHFLPLKPTPTHTYTHSYTHRHTGYLAALEIVVDLVTRGEQDAVMRCGFLSARSTGVAIIYTTGLAPHTPNTQHLQGHNNSYLYRLSEVTSEISRNDNSHRVEGPLAVRT